MSVFKDIFLKEVERLADISQNLDRTSAPRTRNTLHQPIAILNLRFNVGLVCLQF